MQNAREATAMDGELEIGSRASTGDRSVPAAAGVREANDCALHACVEPTPDQTAALDAYFALRQKWNAVHNLSAAGDQALCDRVDALALAAVVDRTLPLMDVGSGNGVPGLLVAVIWPTLPVVLVEPRVKRVAFLRAAVSELGLRHVTIARSRWPVPLTHDVQVVSRAVVSPDEWPAFACQAGVHVRSILRMLALQRPAFAMAAFQLAQALDYRAPDASARRVERWTTVARETP